MKNILLDPKTIMIENRVKDAESSKIRARI
jgi:hypothetical protein